MTNSVTVTALPVQPVAEFPDRRQLRERNPRLPRPPVTPAARDDEEPLEQAEGESETHQIDLSA